MTHNKRVIAQAVCSVLIGRGEQLDRLEDALLAANRGQSHFVVLAGEAGIGKTRLAKELEKRAHKLGCTVLSGGCSEAELALPYLPLLEALGNYLSIEDADVLAAELGSARPELAQLFPQLGSTSVSTTTDPVQMKLRLFESMITLLSIPARRSCVLLVIEDIHWADASTRELLDYLARRLKTLRIMVLATYRSDELHRGHPLLPTVQGWRRAGLTDVIELREMSVVDVRDAISAIFDTTDLSEEFGSFMHDRTEGNPFVLEEMLKEALDRGDIFRSDAGWQRRELDDLRIPETVSDTILLRVQRLDPAEIRVLQAASVLGRSFDYSTLIAVAEADETAVQRLLEAATREQLLEEDRSAPNRYRFRHALTQEAIYAETVLPRRRQIHSDAADFLAAQPSAWPVDIALHLLAAGRYEEAVPVCVEGARQAERTHSYGDAVKLYERALEHVSDPKQRAELLCRTGHALWQDNQPTKAEKYFEEGIPALESAGDEQLLGRYLLTRGRCRWERSRPDLAAADYERARKLLEKRPNADLAVAYLRIAGLHIFELDGHKGLRVAEKAVTTAEEVGARDAYAWALGFLGLAQLDAGDIAHGLDSLDRSYEVALASGYAWIATNTAWNDVWVRVYLMLPEIEERLQRLKTDVPGNFFTGSNMLAASYVFNALGEPFQALEVARNSLRLFEELNAGKYVWRSRLLVAEALLELGRIEEAGHHLPEIATRAEVQDIVYDSYPRLRYHLAVGDADKLTEAARSILDNTGALRLYRVTLALGVEGFLQAGLLDEAKRLIHSGSTLETKVGAPFLEQARGRIRLVEGDAEEARSLFESAAAGFAASRYKLYELRTRVLLAEALAGAGDESAAANELVSVVDEARARGARLVESEVMSTAQGLGLELDIDEDETADGEESDEVSLDAGERLVTVLFADVRGYTAMTASHAPQDMAERIATLQRWAKNEVERHYGLVDKFAGDAVMATFNASGARVDHCEHAMEAAAALQDKAALRDLRLGVGIAVGPAIVGRFVPDGNVSVLGETTNLAARLQAQAREGEIILSADAYKRLGAWLAQRDLQPSSEQLSLKGFDHPVEVYRVERATTSGDAPRSS